MTGPGQAQKPWTDQEQALLKELYLGQVDVGDIAERLGRPFNAIRDRARFLGLRRKAKVNWTKAEIAILRAGYAAGTPPHAIARKIGRPVGGVFNQAFKLGLKLPNRRPWTPEEDEIVRRGHAEGRPLMDIAREIDRKYGTVSKRAGRVLGLDFTRTPRKARPAVAEPVLVEPAAMESHPEPVTEQDKAVKECRIVCLRAAGRLRSRVESVVALAGEFERWILKGDPASRSAALAIAAERYGEDRLVTTAADRYAAWIETGDHDCVDPGEPDDFARLAAAVESVTGISITILQGPARQAKYVSARFMLAWCARQFLGLSDKQIGVRLGGRDRTGIRHGIQSVESTRHLSSVEAKLCLVADVFGGKMPSTQPKPEAEPEKLARNSRQSVEPKRPSRPPVKSGKSSASPRRQKRETPALPDPLTEAQDKVLRAIIRTGKSRSADIAAATGLPLGPAHKVIIELRRKGYVEHQGGHSKVVLLPNGKPLAPPDRAAERAQIEAIDKAIKPVEFAPPPPPAMETPRPPALRAAEKSKDDKSIRACLRCEEDFRSWGPGNRLCPKCRSRASGDDWMGEAVLP